MTGMKNVRNTIVLLVLFLFNLRGGFSQDLTGSTKKPLRVYHTNRMSFTERPLIDGKLNDDCWKTGEWASNYNYIHLTPLILTASNS
jgi:hypothetical protein